MTNADEADVPQSPETQPSDIREQLDQEQISHEGTAQSGGHPHPGTWHQGALESEVTPITPPMRGPGDLVGSEEDDDDDLIDPGDELTPG